MTTIKQVRTYQLESAKDRLRVEIEFMENLIKAAKHRGTPFDTTRIEKLKSLTDDQVLQWAYGDLMV